MSQTIANAALSDQKSLQNERFVQCKGRNVRKPAISTKYCVYSQESNRYNIQV